MKKGVSDLKKAMPLTHISKIATGIVVLLVLLTAMLVTDSRFTVLDDEAQITTAARAPAEETVKLFVWGAGQHEHPPLSDLVLHYWLPFASNPTLLRLPFILLYGAALLLFAMLARQFGGDAAFLALLVMGAFWSFGFHFGRMVGWYSFTFFAVALVTLAYVHWLRQPDWTRWWFLIGASALLVLSNYFGWAILGLLSIDAVFVLGWRRAYKFFVAGTLVLAAVYAPLWRVFSQELHSGISFSANELVTRTVYAAYNAYVLFVSESVAPWYWHFSIPISLAIALCLISTCLLLNRSRALAFLAYFGGLFLFMLASGILNVKRLLFITGWLLVPIAVAVAQRGRARLVLVFALISIAISGATGTIARKYYASLHFIEPWYQIALEAAPLVRNGTSIVTNSPSFLFYLNRVLDPDALPGFIENSHVVFLDADKVFTGFGGPVFFVRGTNINAIHETAEAQSWLGLNCTLLSTDVRMIDTAYALKKRYFKQLVESPYRIVLESYRCP